MLDFDDDPSSNIMLFGHILLLTIDFMLVLTLCWKLTMILGHMLIIVNFDFMLDVDDEVWSYLVIDFMLDVHA